MHQLLPRPTNVDPTDEKLTTSSPLIATGPAWTREVVNAVSDGVLFPRVEWDTANAPTLTIEAPRDVATVPSDLPDSSYTLAVDAHGIRVTCTEPSGLVAALSRLKQCETEDGYETGRIRDEPAFPYRGTHLDVCRHYFATDTVKRLIHLLAALGYNVFHWHLTEDQGWRIPIDAYPRLTEVGAFRTETDGSRYGGFYTHAEISSVIEFAGLHGILVIPEIELPGHARAAIAAYPDLSCEQKPLDVLNEWGVCEDVFCAGNEEVFQVLQTVLSEVVRLFPSRYIHIGGDECPKTKWRACPRCQTRIRDEHLKDEHELQSYFVGRIARFLAGMGRRAIGWDEILEGGLPEGATVMSWRGTEGGIEAARMGHDVIMSPTSHCYFDYKQTDRDDETGFPYPHADGRPPVLTLRDVYTFDPLAGIPAGARDRVLGGQANIWSEQIPDRRTLEYMAAPRLLAMAEVLWSAPAGRDFSNFRGRANRYLERLSEYDWSYARVPDLE